MNKDHVNTMDIAKTTNIMRTMSPSIHFSPIQQLAGSLLSLLLVASDIMIRAPTVIIIQGRILTKCNK